MNVSNPGNSRPAYYDRNPSDIGQAYSASGVAPHITTQRWVYTVPANRKAFIESLTLQILTETAPAPAADAAAFTKLTPLVGSPAISNAVAAFQTAVGNSNAGAWGSVGLLQAGDALGGFTQDGSTGGTKGYQVNAKITEFDA